MTYSRWTPGCCCSGQCTDYSGVIQLELKENISWSEAREWTVEIAHGSFFLSLSNYFLHSEPTASGMLPEFLKYTDGDLYLDINKCYPRYGAEESKTTYYCCAGTGEISWSADIPKDIHVAGLKKMDPSRCPEGHVHIQANITPIPIGSSGLSRVSWDYQNSDPEETTNGFGDYSYRGNGIEINKNNIKLPTKKRLSITKIIGYGGSGMRPEGWYKSDSYYNVYKFIMESEPAYLNHPNVPVNSIPGHWDLVQSDILIKDPSNQTPDIIKKGYEESYLNNVNSQVSLLWSLRAK